jgi:hypothetical protein
VVDAPPEPLLVVDPPHMQGAYDLPSAAQTW